MGATAKILAYTATVIVAGCLLAPPLYWAGQAIAAAGIAPELGRFGFAKFFNRAVLLAAALFAWPLLRWLGIRRMADAGLAPNPARWRHLGIGLAVACLGLGSLAAVMIAIGRAQLRSRIGVDLIPAAFASAAVVAIIEESFFRGALLGALRRRLRWPFALAVLSVIFAAVHFLKPPRRLTFDEVRWTSGFELFPQLFWQYTDPALVVGGFATLLLVGLVLGFTVVRTRSLYLAMGLHAGWVLALKLFGVVAKRTGAPSVWFGRDLLTGLGPVLLMIVSGVVVALLLRARRPPANAAAPLAQPEG